MFKITGLTPYLDNQTYSIKHRLFQNLIYKADLKLVESLEVGEQTLVTFLDQEDKTLVVERVG